MNERITIDPDVWHGQARVRGTRIPVRQIMHTFASANSIEYPLREYSTRLQPIVTR